MINVQIRLKTIWSKDKKKQYCYRQDTNIYLIRLTLLTFSEFQLNIIFFKQARYTDKISSVVKIKQI